MIARRLTPGSSYRTFQTLMSFSLTAWRTTKVYSKFLRTALAQTKNPHFTMKATSSTCNPPFKRSLSRELVSLKMARSLNQAHLCPMIGSKRRRVALIRGSNASSSASYSPIRIWMLASGHHKDKIRSIFSQRASISCLQREAIISLLRSTCSSSSSH